MISLLTYTSQVSNPDLDGHPSTSFVATCKVVRQPRDVTGETGVYRTSDDENARIHHARLLTRVCGDTHDKTDDHDAQERDDERTAFANAIGDVREEYGQDGSRDVNRNSQELGCAGRVPEVLDDRGQEKADSVQRADDLRSC